MFAPSCSPPSRPHLPVSDGHPTVSSPATRQGHAGEIAIRPITSLTDFAACVELQREVWGAEWTDVVPASLMQATSYVGAIILGAFTTSDQLAGFLFGLTGVANGEVLHWSHLLGVRSSARDVGVGRLLKEAQRAELARRNVGRMSWSFDPLVAKNAHLNLNRLGARVVEYVPDMYGASSSPLHYGIATDRLVVTVNTHQPFTPVFMDAAIGDAPVLGLDASAASILEGSSLPGVIRIEVPADIRQLLEDAPDRAADWRAAVRRHFQWAFHRAYQVVGLYREPITSRAFYALERRAT